MKSIKEYLIREGYHYNKNDFSPKDCLEWLIKNHKIEMYDGKIGDEDELDDELSARNVRKESKKE